MSEPAAVPRSQHLQSAEQSAYNGKDELWANERCLKKYNRDIVEKLARHALQRGSVMEFGAGIGTLAGLWEKTTGVRPVCLEIDPQLRQILQERQFQCYQSLDAVDQAFDTIYSSNVLEHIEDDVAILRQLHEKLQPGGTLAVYVPAFMSIYTELDAAVGHYRRYARGELVEKMQRAGFRVERSHYVDCIGYFAWLSVRLRGYKGDRKLGDGKSLAIFDTWLYPLSRLFDGLGLRHLFGKNLLVIARKD